MDEQVSRAVDAQEVPPAWMVGPRSMMVDRVVPRLEFLWMPKTIQPGGKIELVRTRQGVAPERKRGWKVHAHRILRKDRGVEAPAGPILDLRLNAPENWAHAQIFHLPIAAMAREWLGETPTLLVTFATPAYIRRLFGHFGFPVIATERSVKGDIVTPHPSANDALRPARRELVRSLIADLDQRRIAGSLPSGLPAKIFVVRRNTRRLSNEAEIEAYLAADGFVKLYPETMSVPEQLELFNAATEIVGIHGAALAPLLFRSPDAPPFQLIEILSPGHVANSYRLMAAQVGGRYVGVRGRIKPEYIEPAYRLDRFFTTYSLADFSIDLESLKAARAILADGAPPEIVS